MLTIFPGRFNNSGKQPVGKRPAVFIIGGNMFEQTSLFVEKSSGPLEKLLSAIDSGAENNTWILLSGGSSTGSVCYRPGDEFENSSNAIVDLIHWGWFDNRTVFIAYKRELSRDKDKISEDRTMDGLNPEYKNRFAFYSVFKTLIRKISVQDLLDAVDERDLLSLADTLRNRYARSRAIRDCTADDREEKE